MTSKQIKETEEEVISLAKQYLAELEANTAIEFTSLEKQIYISGFSVGATALATRLIVKELEDERD